MDNCAPLSPPHTSVISTSFRSIKFLHINTGISGEKKIFSLNFRKTTSASEVITVALIGEVNFHYVFAMPSLTASYKFPQKKGILCFLSHFNSAA